MQSKFKVTAEKVLEHIQKTGKVKGFTYSVSAAAVVKITDWLNANVGHADKLEHWLAALKDQANNCVNESFDAPLRVIENGKVLELMPNDFDWFLLIDVTPITGCPVSVQAGELAF